MWRGKGETGGERGPRGTREDTEGAGEGTARAPGPGGETKGATCCSVYDGTSLGVTKGLRGPHCQGLLWLHVENRPEGTQRSRAVPGRSCDCPGEMPAATTRALGVTAFSGVWHPQDLSVC